MFVFRFSFVLLQNIPIIMSFPPQYFIFIHPNQWNIPFVCINRNRASFIEIHLYPINLYFCPITTHKRSLRNDFLERYRDSINKIKAYTGILHRYIFHDNRYLSAKASSNEVRCFGYNERKRSLLLHSIHNLSILIVSETVPFDSGEMLYYPFCSISPCN